MWAGPQVPCQVFEVIELGRDATIDFDSEFILVFETVLEVAEEATSARDGERHAAELAKYSMPLLEGNSLVAFEIGKKFQQTRVLVGREGEDAKKGINNPTKKDLPGSVTGIALRFFFVGGHVFASRRIGGVQGSEDVVKGMDQGTSVVCAFSSIPLDNAHEVIDIDIVAMNGGLE